jgi:muconolactone delta-isomerase
MSRSEWGLRSAKLGLGFLLAGGLCAGALGQSPYAGPGGAGYRNPITVFDAMDRNGDGTVTAEEHAQFRANRMAARSAQGRLLRNAGNAPTFQALDADNNGVVTRAELTGAQSARMAARGGGYGRGAGYGYGRGGGPRGGGPCLWSWQGN